MLLEIDGNGTAVYQDPATQVSFWAPAEVDADGSPLAYNPSDTGLDALADAKDQDGNWVGIAVDENGDPYIQGESDPAPGYYVSTTSYEWPQYAVNDPRRYLDASTVPFVVVPESVRLAASGIVLGCLAIVTNDFTGESVVAVVGDIGPACGEISIAAAKAIGVNPDPRNGGDSRPHYHYRLFPGVPAVLTIKGVQVTFMLIEAAAGIEIENQRGKTWHQKWLYKPLFALLKKLGFAAIKQ